MRERLIELLLKSDPLHERDLDDDLVEGEVEAIADYLLANGVIVPPVKVGDTVYSFSEDFGTVLPYFVDELRISFMDQTRNYWVYEASCHNNETDEFLDEIDFDLDDIGKSVFLTEQEAMGNQKNKLSWSEFKEELDDGKISEYDLKAMYDAYIDDDAAE